MGVDVGVDVGADGLEYLGRVGPSYTEINNPYGWTCDASRGLE